MQPYLKALKDWLPSVNGKFFVRDLVTIEKESTLGHLTVIIEFPSKEESFILKGARFNGKFRVKNESKT